MCGTRQESAGEWVGIRMEATVECEVEAVLLANSRLGDGVEELAEGVVSYVL